MAHHKITLAGKAEYHDMDPVIEFDGLEITVKAGTFYVNGLQYSLSADEVVTFDENTNTGYKVQVRGYLVEDTGGTPGELLLLVDEVSTDPDFGEEPYNWHDPGNVYKLVYDLFHFNLYPNDTDILAKGASTVNIGPYNDGDFVSYHLVVVE